VPGLDFFTPGKKIRANIRYWEAKVLLRRKGAQDREKRAVLGLPVIRAGLTGICRGSTGIPLSCSYPGSGVHP